MFIVWETDVRLEGRNDEDMGVNTEKDTIQCYVCGYEHLDRASVFLRVFQQEQGFQTSGI